MAGNVGYIVGGSCVRPLEQRSNTATCCTCALHYLTLPQDRETGVVNTGGRILNVPLKGTMSSLKPTRFIKV